MNDQWRCVGCNGDIITVVERWRAKPTQSAMISNGLVCVRPLERMSVVLRQRLMHLCEALQSISALAVDDEPEGRPVQRHRSPYRTAFIIITRVYEAYHQNTRLFFLGAYLRPQRCCGHNVAHRRFAFCVHSRKLTRICRRKFGGALVVDIVGKGRELRW